MEDIQTLKAEVQRLKRVLAPNEDERLTAVLKSAFKTLNLDNHECYGRESKGPRYRLTQKELAQMMGMPVDQLTLYKIGQSLSVLGWRRTTSLGRVYYVISVEEFDEFLSAV